MINVDELGRGIDVYLNDILADGLKGLFTLSPDWKTAFVGFQLLLAFFFIVFVVASFSGASLAKNISKFTAWLLVTTIIMYPFLYWVDKSGFWSGLTFFLYFLYTYSVLGREHGSASIAANLIAAAILFGLILWYYTWDMVLFWLKSVGLWLFLFNLFLAGGFRKAIEGEESKYRLVATGLFIAFFFAVIVYLGDSFVDKSVACREWDGVKPIWK